MRKRSEIRGTKPAHTIVDDPAKALDEWRPTKDDEIVGQFCEVCGHQQYLSLGGTTCVNGHGGMGGVDESVAKKIRTKRAGEAGEALAEEMKSAQEKEDRDEVVARNPLAWESANRPKRVNYDPHFGGIIEKIVVAEPLKEYEALEAALHLGDKIGDHGAVARSLDKAESFARRAHRLWQAAALERRRWERDNEVVFAAMRSMATRSLQSEKEQKVRSKQITDADVEARVASLYPDEWREQEGKRDRMKSMVDSMQNLAEVWMSRCRTLQTLHGKQR